MSSWGCVVTFEARVSEVRVSWKKENGTLPDTTPYLLHASPTCQETRCGISLCIHGSNVQLHFAFWCINQFICAAVEDAATTGIQLAKLSSTRRKCPCRVTMLTRSAECDQTADCVSTFASDDAAM